MVLFYCLHNKHTTHTCPFKTTFTRIYHKLSFFVQVSFSRVWCKMWTNSCNNNKRYNDICQKKKERRSIVIIIHNLINAINEHGETFPDTFFLCPLRCRPFFLLIYIIWFFLIFSSIKIISIMHTYIHEICVPEINHLTFICKLYTVYCLFLLAVSVYDSYFIRISCELKLGQGFAWAVLSKDHVELG